MTTYRYASTESEKKPNRQMHGRVWTAHRDVCVNRQKAPWWRAELTQRAEVHWSVQCVLGTRVTAKLNNCLRQITDSASPEGTAVIYLHVSESPLLYTGRMSWVSVSSVIRWYQHKTGTLQSVWGNLWRHRAVWNDKLPLLMHAQTRDAREPSECVRGTSSRASRRDSKFFACNAIFDITVVVCTFATCTRNLMPVTKNCI